VWAGAPLADARAGALLLLIPFGVLGVGLAALVFFIPGRAISRAERRIDALIARLEHSQSALAELQPDPRAAGRRARSSELRAKEQRLRELSSRAVLLQEAERRVIARELHDSAGQALTAIRINLQIIAQLAEQSGGNERVAGLASRTLTIADATLEEIRRAVSMLGPAILDDVGLVAAIQRLCDDFGERSDLRIDSELAELPQRWPQSAALESVCYRVAQEALTNVARHARATHVRVALTLDPGAVPPRDRRQRSGVRPQPATPGFPGWPRPRRHARTRRIARRDPPHRQGQPRRRNHVTVDLPQVTLSEDGDDTALVVA
jgi:signal transduction histidine kinase